MAKTKRIAKLRNRRKEIEKKQRAERRATRQREKGEKQAQKSMPTANAKMINDLMVEDKIKGNFKDYVIISGNRLINWKGSFEIHLDEGVTTGVNGVALIHKNKLHNVIGEEEAARFWHPQFGRLVEVPEGTKSSKKDA